MNILQPACSTRSRLSHSHDGMQEQRPALCSSQTSQSTGTYLEIFYTAQSPVDLCTLSIIILPISLTDDKGLLGLSPMLVVPRGSASCVDGPFGRAQEGRLGLALAGGPLPGREACADRLEEPVQGSIPTAARKKHYTCDHAG